MKKRKITNALAAFFAAMLVALVAMVLVSCENEPDVQQAYPFTVETMPVPTRIVNGETVEIRCELRREGRFSDARYTIRYFHLTAKARSAWMTGWCCCPMTDIRLTGRCSRLYYTSACEEQQTIDIYFEDNSELEQLFLLSFDFNNEKKDEPGEEIEDPVVGSETPWVRDSLVIVRPPVSKSEKVSVCE